jgi:site-specific recombinase XerD
MSRKSLPKSQLQHRMLGDLELAGMGPKTQRSYTAAVRGLAKHYRKSPDQLTEEQVRDYILHCKRVRKLAIGTMRPIVYGIKFFYRQTAPRNWPLLQAIKLPKRDGLPIVLDREDVRRLLNAVREPCYRAAFRLMYGCGLRNSDVRMLEVNDVNSRKMQLHVRRSKGLKDRIVPLAKEVLDALRAYWVTHRHPRLVFPTRVHPIEKIAMATKPMHERSIQRVFAQVVAELGLQRPGLRPHTLRHCYATHLLEEGINLRVLQQYMGHKNLQATEIYLHLSAHGQEHARQVVARLMHDLLAE